MDTFLWIISGLMILTGAVWLTINQILRRALAGEYDAFRSDHRKATREEDQRHLQLYMLDTEMAQETNRRNRPIAIGVLILGVVLLLVQITRSCL